MALGKRQFLKLAAAAGTLPLVGARAARAADRPDAIGVDYAYYNPVSLLLKKKGWRRPSPETRSACAGC